MTDTEALSSVRARQILGVLFVSQLLVWLDNTILATALETLGDPRQGLAASPSQLQWATGAYTLVFATLMLGAGTMGDRFGHRTALLAGMAIFGSGSLAGAYAGTPLELIAWRAVMGVGAALVMPSSMAILTWTFTGPRRAAALGLYSASSGLGLFGGPLLAGALLDHFWWGSIFLVNVPIVVLGILGIVLVVPNFRSSRPRRIDLPGLVLSTAGLAVTAFGLIRAGQLGSWRGPEVIGPLVGGVALLAVFVFVQSRTEEPSLDPRLFLRRTFAGGNAALALLFFTIAGATFYTAFYLQGVRSFSPWQAGMASMPVAIGMVIGASITTRLVARWSVATVCSVALIGNACAMAMYALFGLRTPIVWNEVLVFAQGFTIGMVVAPVTVSVLASLPQEQAGTGSAVANTVRQAGGVLGIAVLGTVMTFGYRNHVDAAVTAGLTDRVRAAVLDSPEQARQIAKITARPALADAANEAFLHAMHIAAMTTAVVLLVAAAVLALTFRQAKAAAASEAITPHSKPDSAEGTADELTRSLHDPGQR